MKVKGIETERQPKKKNLLSSVTPSWFQILAKAASDNAHFKVST